MVENLIEWNQTHRLFSKIVYEFSWGTSAEYQDVVEELTLQYGNKKIEFRETSMKITQIGLELLRKA
jgi:hypothetical protein